MREKMIAIPQAQRLADRTVRRREITRDFANRFIGGLKAGLTPDICAVPLRHQPPSGVFFKLKKDDLTGEGIPFQVNDGEEPVLCAVKTTREAVKIYLKTLPTQIVTPPHYPKIEVDDSLSPTRFTVTVRLFGRGADLKNSMKFDVQVVVRDLLATGTKVRVSLYAKVRGVERHLETKTGTIDLNREAEIQFNDVMATCVRDGFIRVEYETGTRQP